MGMKVFLIEKIGLALMTIPAHFIQFLSADENGFVTRCWHKDPLIRYMHCAAWPLLECDTKKENTNNNQQDGADRYRNPSKRSVHDFTFFDFQ